MSHLLGQIVEAGAKVMSLGTLGWEERVSEMAPLLNHYGGLILFVSILTEHLGLPFPAIPAMLAAGAFARAGQMSPRLAFGLPIAGCLLADMAWYLLGRFRGRRILGWFCRFANEPGSCVIRTEGLFLRYRVASLLFSKFLPGTGAVIRPLAAVAGMGALPFLIYDGLGTLLYTGTFVGAGYLYSDQLAVIARFVVNLGHVLILLALATASFLILYGHKLMHGRLCRPSHAVMTEPSPKQKTLQGAHL